MQLFDQDASGVKAGELWRRVDLELEHLFFLRLNLNTLRSLPVGSGNLDFNGHAEEALLRFLGLGIKLLFLLDCKTLLGLRSLLLLRLPLPAWSPLLLR